MVIGEEILFKIPLIFGKLDNINNQEIVEETLKIHDIQRRVSDDPSHTSYEDYDVDLFPEFEKVVSNIANDLMGHTGYKECSLQGWWAHITEPDQSTDIHAHNPDDYESTCGFVYYARVPKNAGILKFRWEQPNETTAQLYSITPEEGQYIVFPRYLSHYVTRNISNEYRVSLSGDFSCF